MKKRKDLLNRATEALNKMAVPPGPPSELLDATVAKLVAAADEPVETTGTSLNIVRRMKITTNFMKFAAAAVLLIAVGCLIGRFSAPKPPDAQELYAALKPAIQQDLLEPMNRYWLLTLASNNDELKNEIASAFRRDLHQVAVQTLAASGAATNQLLRDFIESVKATQMQERRSVAAALRQIEFDRMRDRAQLADGLETLAVLTGDELQRTKQDIIVQLLTYEPSAGSSPNMYESPNTNNEREQK